MTATLAPPRPCVHGRPPEPDPGSTRTALPDWLRAESRELRAAQDVALDLATALRDGPSGAADLPATLAGGPDQWVDLLLDQAREALSRLRAPWDHAVDRNRADDLEDLVVRAHATVDSLRNQHQDARAARFTAASEALVHLRRLPTSTELVDRVCQELVARCGFGRAVLSRVSAGAWSPWLAHFRDPAEPDRWFSPWIDRTIPLEDDEPEVLLMHDRRPALVRDTASTAVSRKIIVDAGHSQAYVAAPVIAAGEVVGILHADHLPAGRLVDHTDRDVLWAVAENFGLLYERMATLERVRAQEDRLRHALSAIPTGDDLDRRPAASAQPDARRLDDLTVRENEVLSLIVAGAANRTIADRLVISEDTVKTHVKHILRKLGALNRSQAIAIATGRAPAR